MKIHLPVLECYRCLGEQCDFNTYSAGSKCAQKWDTCPSKGV